MKYPTQNTMKFKTKTGKRFYAKAKTVESLVRVVAVSFGPSVETCSQASTASVGQLDEQNQRYRGVQAEGTAHATDVNSLASPENESVRLWTHTCNVEIGTKHYF